MKELTFTRIINDDQYNEVLARMVIGARFIESPEFKKLPKPKQEAAWRKYNRLDYMVAIYKGWVS